MADPALHAERVRGPTRAVARRRGWGAGGLFDEYLAALKEIEFRLTVEPHEWGESREHLDHLRVQLRCGTSRMVTVLYGVSDARDVVFVKEFRINRKYRPQSPP